MTYYICNRQIIDCMFCGVEMSGFVCKHTSDYNYAKNKGKPMTFVVETMFQPAKKLINKGPAYLWEVPYVGSDE